MSIKDLLAGGDLALTPSEEKIIRQLLAEYPTSGLGTVSGLARKSGVSDPTVVRLVSKLGFDSFAAFQTALLAEVGARLHSPLHMPESRRAEVRREDAFSSYFDSVAFALQRSEGATAVPSYDRACRLLAEAKGRVWVLGGRVSRNIATILAGYMTQMRPSVMAIGSLSAQDFDLLADIGRNDVVVAFDYRRYQLDVISFTRQAVEGGAKVVLFTDQWLSPLAQVAEVALVSQTEVDSPFDTLVPAMAQVEAVAARLRDLLGEKAGKRMEHLEDVRHRRAITLDSVPPAPPRRPRKTRPGALGRS
ncbi:MAG: MurR/RpiR family transcriptional regulator [Paracoccaceae bacterium]